MKEKRILPSLREKKRYIIYEVISNKKLNFRDVSSVICQGILRFLGEIGCAKAGVIILDKWNDNKGVMKVNHKYVDEIISALALVKDINGQKVIVKTVKTSGVLNKVLGYMEV